MNDLAEQDPQLDLKKRARRRLVGAAALALLAAIVLPLIMDQEPKPVGQEIQIRIPSQSAPGAPLLAEKPAAVSVPVEPAPAPVANGAPTAPAAAPAVAAPATAPASPVAAPAKAEEKAKPLAKAEEKPKPAGKTEAEPKATATLAPPSDPARAEAILNGAEAPVQTGAASGKFIVQLGVFGDAGNVKKLRERIKGQGYNSFTENLQTDKGVKIRVRAGPFSTKEAAVKARDSLKRHTGIDGIVTEK